MDDFGYYFLDPNFAQSLFQKKPGLMKSITRGFAKFRVVALTLCSLLLVCLQAHAQTDPLPSWNDGQAKQAILAFVRATTDQPPRQEKVCVAVALYHRRREIWQYKINQLKTNRTSSSSWATT
jgi:hypothetical protein